MTSDERSSVGGRGRRRAEGGGVPGPIWTASLVGAWYITLADSGLSRPDFRGEALTATTSNKLSGVVLEALLWGDR